MDFVADSFYFALLPGLQTNLHLNPLTLQISLPIFPRNVP